MAAVGRGKQDERGSRNQGISLETQSLVENMMKQSGVNHKKAALIRDAIRTVGTLPMPKVYAPKASMRSFPETNRQRAMNGNNSDRGRRTSSTIESEVLRNPVRREAPSLKGMDRDLERERFARHMQFEGLVPQVMPRKQKDDSEEDRPTEQILADRFSELLGQVEENQEFLSHMSALGQKEKYRNTITAEIAEKVREMNRIDSRLGQSGH